ncbi:hypothetical protein VTK26DRAFT_3519 [Humicola hyalothermophila]
MLRSQTARPGYGTSNGRRDDILPTLTLTSRSCQESPDLRRRAQFDDELGEWDRDPGSLADLEHISPHDTTPLTF